MKLKTGDQKCKKHLNIHEFFNPEAEPAVRLELNTLLGSVLKCRNGQFGVICIAELLFGAKSNTYAALHLDYFTPGANISGGISTSFEGSINAFLYLTIILLNRVNIKECSCEMKYNYYEINNKDAQHQGQGVLGPGGHGEVQVPPQET